MPGRARVYRAEGIVLRRRNLGEADSIFTVFSREEGKFDAIAKGVRKPRSRMRGHLEPLTRSRFLIAQGRTLDVFTQAETVDGYRGVREDLGRSAEALYCLELVARFTEEREALPDLYALIVETLEAFDGGAGELAARWFELNLLALLGYEPRVDACAVCGGSLPAEDSLLSAAAGGLVCRACRGEAGSGRIVPVTVIKLLRFARTASAGAFARIRVEPEAANALRAALADLIRQQLDRDPNARRFVERLASLPTEA